MTTIHDTLISVQALAHLIDHAKPGELVVLDCSFELTDLEAGRAAYDTAHVPGARYVHLEDMLSAAKTGRNGRHPLPEPTHFVQSLAALGIGEQTQVAAYDNAGGMYAARLWWMMRWIGHRASAVLDGGFAAWKAAGHVVSSGEPAPAVASNLQRLASLVRTVDYDTLRANLESGERLIIDARAPDRFRGENETMDPVGGHIPGARNRLFRDNLGADGRFKPAGTLRTEFEALTTGRAPAELVSQCGSGVTACHNLLAMEVAGLSGAALYPGSWSEWCAQPGAPVETGTASAAA